MFATNSFKTLLAAGALALMAGGANAATVTTIKQKSYEGNDCSGAFGQGFESCIDPVYKSPIIAKVDFYWDYDGEVDLENSESNGFVNAVWTINSAFSAVTSAMFSFTFDGDEGQSGTWTYTPCGTCPSITSFVAKGGNGFTHYWSDPQTALLTGSWSIGKGLSHLSFYDTKPATVPVPAAGFLLMGALGGLAALRRRRRAA